MIPHDRFVAATQPGIYESHYLKATSPDAERALWIKHTVLRRTGGDGVGEFWAVRFRRGHPPDVCKREVPFDALALDPGGIALDCGPIGLRPDRARGTIARAAWDLRLSDAGPPLVHFPYAAMYTGGFPKKKILTPAPNLRFDGTFHWGDDRWALDGWRGLRGHNWGTEHAWAYAYGSCNSWDDGDPRRAVDGFTAKVRIAGRPTPWMSVVVGASPKVAKNQVRHWFGAGEVSERHWRVAHTRSRVPVELEFVADPAEYAGLRYLHPSGAESYCYNSKRASVRYQVGDAVYTSRAGELEVLFAEPIRGVPLHPTPDWRPSDGDYHS